MGAPRQVVSRSGRRTGVSHASGRTTLAGFFGLPRVLQLGLSLLALGAVGDVAFHALPPVVAADVARELGIDADGTHVVILVGMVTTITAVLQRGTRRDRRA
jgi:hypothetical protein